MIFTATLLSLLSAIPLSITSPLSRRQYSGQDTENQLTNGTPCRAVTVLFARGTTEPGNVGTIAGPPFFQALANDIGSSNLAVQGVDYAANVAGFLEGGDPAGSATLASLIGTAQTQCPNTKLVVSGYSQGGQLVHNAAKMISASETAFINSVVIFGDPDDGKPVGSVPASKVLIICAAGDDICAGGDIISAAHLSYGIDAGEAASFVKTQSGVA